MIQKTFYHKCFSNFTDNINVHYCSDFLDQKTADKYFNILESNLIFNSDEESQITIYGKKHYIPRKQVAYGDENLFYNFSGLSVNCKSWDGKDIVSIVLRNLRRKVEKFTGKKYNFVLINRYKDGESMINFHRDKETELGGEPCIAGVSLGAAREFKFKADKFIPRIMPKEIEFLVEYGSLMVMYHPTNKYWMHSVPRRLKVTKPRISLTFRYIHKDKI